MEKYHFQYCQKIVILSQDKTKILLCKRKGEADYDGIFSFAGGKMETTDGSLIEGLKREKDEEIGENFKIKLLQTFSLNKLYKKKDGNTLILPHYLATHQTGEVTLNTEEYSEYQWVEINKLEEFEPKVSNIPDVIEELFKLEKIADEKDFITI
jgi:ADP-ribose pyrophosphatase YjhB (NUDIX family)